MRRERFSAWMDGVQDGLRVALIAGHGVELGVEAASDALVYAWEHWDRIEKMDNPAGYVYRVGQRMARHDRRRYLARPVVFPMPSDDLPHVEPGLPKAMSRLTERQREVIALVCALDYSLQEVADMLGLAKGTIQTHVDRGMAKLRQELGVGVDA